MTLSQTATFTRRFILGFAIFSVLGITSYVGYGIWYSNYLASLPPQEERPDTKFGILPQPELPPSKTLTGNFTYSLDTATGSLPEFGKLIKVYFMPKATSTFLAAQRAKDLAEKFKFDNSPQILTQTRYRFQIDNKMFTVDLDSGNFVYQTDVIPSGEILDDDSKLVSDFKNFLSQMGVLGSELNSDRFKIKHEAQVAQINLWPKDIDKIPIVFSDINKSLVRAEVTGSAGNLENYRSINFTFWPIDTFTFATYPLKPPALAFEEIKSGKASFIVKPNFPQVSITSMYLAYFEAENYTPYLQPLYIFEGPGFAAYVTALPDEFLSE